MNMRKIQQTGGSSYIVTLPKDWVTGNKLRPGDPVMLSTQDDGTILIDTPQRHKKGERVSVDLEGMSQENLLRKLISIYMMVRGSIELKSAERINPKLRQTVREATMKLIGFEVVEETANSIIIQDILDPGELSMPKSLRRMSLLTHSMFSDAMAALKEGDRTLAEDIIIRDDEVDRLHWLICKQFNLIILEPSLTTKMGAKSLEAVHYRSASKNLERISDHSARIAQNVLEGGRYGEAVVSSIEELSPKVSKMISDSTSAVLNKDFDLANEVIESMKVVAQTRAKVMKQISRQKEAAVNLAYIMDSIERVASYSTDIAEVAIDLNAISAKS